MAALVQRILDQWLTYLESNHLHIYKEGDFDMNLLLHKDLLVFVTVLVDFDMFWHDISMSDIRICLSTEYQVIGFVRVHSIR